MNINLDYILIFNNPIRIQKQPLYYFESRGRKKRNCSGYNIFTKHMFFYSQLNQNKIIRGDVSRVSISSNEEENEDESISIRVVAQKWNSYNKRLKRAWKKRAEMINSTEEKGVINKVPFPI